MLSLVVDVSQCTPVISGQLAGSDSNDHDDAKYDDHNKVDGQHNLLEPMSLDNTNRQIDRPLVYNSHRC